MKFWSLYAFRAPRDGRARKWASPGAKFKGGGGGGRSLLLFWITIFKILVDRNSPSIGENFGEIFRPLRIMGCVPLPCPNSLIWAENLVFLILEQK